MASRNGARFGSIIDRYLLGLALKPLLIGVGVLLIALLLGRVLRLVNILADAGSTEFGLLATLVASLVPHYLGLAITAALVAAVFVAMIRLGDGSELDALLSSGLSLGRISAPFLGLGLVLAALSFVLYGWLNPVSRYDYRSLIHSATSVVSRTDIQPGSFLDAGNGATISADQVFGGARRVEGVFIHQIEDGRERVTTASSGEVALGDDGVNLKLILQDGISVIQDAGGSPVRTQFRRLNFQTTIPFEAQPFRERGTSERELTVPELWQEMRAPRTEIAPRIVEAELIDRVLRPLSLVFMPLLAIPLSLATKRGSRATGLVVAAVLLVTFNNALQLGKDIGAAGHGPPILTAGLPFLVFAGLAVALFASASRHPTQAPLGRAIDRLQARLGAMARPLRRRTAREAA
ncbi:LptF/LptG family permease [Aureimonas psammosilenae]|uniref:LptF/LptG family permease n=1 Tax=Aureimonas psammosilenae TaxID=2495496 RepID=UPI0018699F74|nr:LptF/LptG family permease [Aureimonas psammosilenae]